VISRTTPKEMTDQIITIVKNAVNKGRDLFEVCKTTRNGAQSKFGGLWQCNAFYDDIGDYSCSVDNNCFVSLKFDKLRIAVHKVYEEVSLIKCYI